MNQGKIVEYIDQGRFVCTLCLQDKGNKLHLLTASNREVNLSPKRAVLISEPTINTKRPRMALLERLKQTEEIRKKLKSQVNVKELWELIYDEKQHFGHRYLAQLVFGDEITDDHLSAMVRALFEDRLYFKMKDGHFQPNSEERVERIIKERREKALKLERLELGSAWLRGLLQGIKETEDPPFREEITQLLVDLALYGNESPNFKYGKEMLLRAGVSDVKAARDILIRLGVWEEDENLDLHRLGVSMSFNQKQKNETEMLSRKTLSFNGREDLRNLDSLTIDGPLTRDYDDALSLDWDGNSFQLGIHIADVAETILPESPLDREALERASSLYLPRKQIPMMPPSLSQDLLSLRQGCDRSAISLIVNMDGDGEILDYRFVPSVIRVKHQLTYDQVNGSIPHETKLQKMHGLAHQLRQKRINRGAFNLSLPELQIKFEEDAMLSLAWLSQESSSRMIVAEFMILYNWLAGKFCSDNHIPVLFRAQPEPSERLSRDEMNYLFLCLSTTPKAQPSSDRYRAKTTQRVGTGYVYPCHIPHKKIS